MRDRKRPNGLHPEGMSGAYDLSEVRSVAFYVVRTGLRLLRNCIFVSNQFRHCFAAQDPTIAAQRPTIRTPTTQTKANSGRGITMRKYISTLLICASFMFASNAIAQTAEEIAKAYVQAITDGPGSKSAGTIDFAQMGCSPATVFDEARCQKAVKDGKDGKTFLMEAITSANIATLVPPNQLKRANDTSPERAFDNLGDPKFEETRQMFGYLSTKDNGWYSQFEGASKAKGILQRHLEALGSGGMYGEFVWPFDKASAAQAKIVESGIKFKVAAAAAQSTLRTGPLYYWALQTDFSAMAYPPSFAYPTLPSKPADFCKNTTTAWGHVGFQYTKTRKMANWGGGGDGSGVADYSCGGTDVTDVTWQTGKWYEYKVKRGANQGPKLWKWKGTITDVQSGTVVYDYDIFGGEHITYGVVWTELIGVKCDDPEIRTEWKEPYYANSAGKFRVGRINKSFTNDACLRSKQETVLSGGKKCPAHWRQDQGSQVQPAQPAAAAELRAWNSQKLTEDYCPRTPSPTEVAIAKAYVNAISDGAGAKAVSAAIDFSRNGCSSLTVWEETHCQAAVFNGKDGKTVLMESITAVSGGANWRNSNITTLIPQADMRRIMTDTRYSKAKDLFGYMADPNNNWYSWLAGDGKAKDVLRRYMEASR